LVFMAGSDDDCWVIRLDDERRGTAPWTRRGVGSLAGWPASHATLWLGVFAIIIVVAWSASSWAAPTVSSSSSSSSPPVLVGVEREGASALTLVERPGSTARVLRFRVARLLTGIPVRFPTASTWATSRLTRAGSHSGAVRQMRIRCCWCLRMAAGAAFGRARRRTLRFRSGRAARVLSPSSGARSAARLRCVRYRSTSGWCGPGKLLGESLDSRSPRTSFRPASRVGRRRERGFW
jgi:hypothetical protein